MPNEHIVISDELADQSIEPTRVGQQESITNRIKGVVTELVFYDEGYLKVHETRKGKRARDHLIELRFLDPEPVASQHTATGFLWSALVLGLLALLAAFVTPMTNASPYALSATVMLSTLAVVALLCFIQRSEVKHRFVTASGRAVALTLSGSFGCVGRSRRVVDAVRDAIGVARKNTATRDGDYLRAEMKAHYKLAETGVITREACADGTTQILSKFN